MWNPERFIVGFSLAIGISLLLYLEYSFLVLLLIEFATLYDCVKLYQTVHKIVPSLIIAITLTAGNALLYTYYHLNVMHMVHLVALVQLSDVAQYIGGNYYGRHYLGALSPKKTYEGYLISLMVMMWYPFLNFEQILVYWSCGVLGGLLSSAFKRYLGIKDFSNLLGAHGGWLDRTDSVYLTVIVAYNFT